ENAGRRATARKYALGIALCEVGWILTLFLPHQFYLYGWAVMIPLELSVPMLAERHEPTRWHPHHIIERYACFTLIVIGESVLSATTALEVATDAGLSAPFVAIIIGSILVLFSFWWLYFSQSHHHITSTSRATFAWGYGHYFIFAALAATGGGIAAATDIVVEGKVLYVASAAVAVPCAVYVVMLWVLCIRYLKYGLGPIFAIAVAALLGSIALPWPVLPAGLVMVALAVVNTFVQQKHDAAEHADGHQHRSSDSGH
ncbi:MAG TPA: low temperature requirement protein A, partial [Kofleriaceae bacterium]